MARESFGICPVLSVFLVLLYENAVYNYVFAFRILSTLQKDISRIVYVIIFNILWSLTAWSYLRTRCTNPGRLPDRWDAFVQQATGRLAVGTGRGGWQPGKVTSCKKCNGRVRPERAHHCSICEHCVMRMDHHCPWTGTCVGFVNHKFFILLLVYGSLCSLFAFVSAAPQLLDFLHSMLSHLEELPGAAERLGISSVEAVLFAVFGALALVVFVLLTILLVTHGSLAANSSTSIEELYTNMENPYDLQSSYSNLEQIFGDCGLDWLLPVMPWRPVCDGLSFRRHDEEIPSHLEGALMFSDSDEEEDSILQGGRAAEALWEFRYRARMPTRGAGW
eukprot:TRINITY_DN13292_c0_g1_i2.p1 TRINITY_DN13292_c0_g1~~TRINITY_DN13292_c0_g1_i2.p1  ORF type:complete len:334 (-),score=54.69 TRINITY_DN13292_c0_g1_i2:106-1107(-)